MYDELRQENKINEIVVERPKRSMSKEPSLNNLHKDKADLTHSTNKDKTSNSPVTNNNSPGKLRKAQYSYKDLLNNPNRLIVFGVKEDNPNEKFLIAKKYIKVLSQSEFYMI